MNKTISKKDEILKTSFALWYEVNSKKNDETRKVILLHDFSFIIHSLSLGLDLPLKKQSENKPQKLSYLQKLRIFLN